MAKFESYAEALGALGIDPESFLKVAPDAVARFDAQHEEAVLEGLAGLAKNVHGAGLKLYFALESCAAPLAECFAGHPEDFLRATDDLAAIATELGDGSDRALQRGIPSLCYGCEGRPWLVSASMEFARHLAEAGVEPGNTLLEALPSLAAVPGQNPARFSSALDAVQTFVLALDERGVHATYPIQQGVRGTVEAWAAEPEGFAEALGDLCDLVIVLQDAGLSPYPVLEYGVSVALPAAAGQPWLRAEVFPLAATLGAQGIDPILMLQEGVRCLAALPEDYGAAALRWAQEAAEDGVDPGWLMGHSVVLIANQCSDTEAFDRALLASGKLARAIRRHDHQPMLTFEYGLPSALGHVDLERTLAVATALANQGIDPGPPLNHGFGTLSYACAELPLTREGALVCAEALAAGGRSPWRLLEQGLPAALVVAGENDDAAARDLVHSISDLLTALHREGIETDDLLLFGIHPLARSCSGERALFEDVLSLLRDLVAVLAKAKLSPIQTVGSGLPAITKVSNGDPARLREGAAFARSLAKKGIDPGPLLVHAVPALGFDCLDDVGALAQTVHRGGLSTEALGPALAALAHADASSLAAAMSVAGQLADDGVDPAIALSSSLPALIQAFDEAQLLEASQVLREALTEAHRRSLPAEGMGHWAFESAIRVADGETEALTGTLASAVEAATSVAKEAPTQLDVFLLRATDAAAHIAGGQADAFDSLMAALAQWTIKEAGAPGIDAVLDQGLAAIAAVAKGQPKGALELLPPLAALASLGHAEALCTAGLSMARLGAHGDTATFARGLKDLCRIGTGEARPDLYFRMERLAPLAHRLPDVWNALIVPVCLGVGAGAPAVLDGLCGLAPYLQEPGDLALVKEIVTQQGLRAPDVLAGLLFEGLRNRQIRSLAEDRELLRGFINDVPFADPDYYAAYRRIMTDPGLSPQEQRAAVGALEESLGELTEAVIQGEVDREQQGHPLFAHALSYIFPASRSAGRREYQRLFDEFPDGPEHLESLSERGPLPPSEVRLATGGYRVREGQAVDVTPWGPLAEAVKHVAHGRESEEPQALGESLFDAWIAGHLARQRTKESLLARIYQAHCAVAPGLPDTLDDAGAMLKYREFLSDTALEIIQDALTAFRATDPERYERQAHAKLAPRRQVGKGLLRGVARTCQAHREGAIDDVTLRERLIRQLRGFDVEAPGSVEALLAAPESSLHDVVQSLPRVGEEVALGEEHHRVLADLTGSEIAAMGRELFGDEQHPAKVEYSAAGGGPDLKLRLQPTKRRAHAPIGLCEGVCTAVDLQLWQKPEFLQCIIWGADRRARGGMHLLRVERTIEGRDERALSLPGINPTLELLREVGPNAVLDALLGYAKKLSAAWRLDEVWIPTHRGIMSNRGPIQQALTERNFNRRSVAGVTFSHSPYAYTFDEVWLVP
jgi:hypothetical protein